MSSDPSSPPTSTEQKARRRIRLRLITLGEIVGVLALLIAGLSWWDNHREHVKVDREEAQAARTATARQALLLKASGGGDRLTLQAASAEAVIQSQTVYLPTELRDAPIRTTGDARIERAWLERGVLDALKRVGGSADQAGDRRLPIAIETVFLTDGETRTDRAVYDVGYAVHARLLRGDSITLEGLSLVRRAPKGDLRAMLDALWAQRTAAETAAALAAKPPPG